MKALAALTVSTLAVLAAGTGLASAHTTYCERGFYAHARAPNGLNFEPPRFYDSTALARGRAIAIWKTKVRTLCPEHSTFWWRSFDKHVACEGTAGGITCDVRARPTHKLFR